MPHDSEYDFAFTLAGVAEVCPAIEDALFVAGCDDATLSVRAGRVSLEFTRAAPSLREAVLAAIRDVRRAGIGAEVLRVDADNAPADLAVINGVLEGERQRRLDPILADAVRRVVAADPSE